VTLDRPAWLDAFVERARRDLGIDHWLLYVDMADIPNPHDPEADGSLSINHRYLYATMTLRATKMAEDTPGGRELILHELLHLAMAAPDHAVEQIVNIFIPKIPHRQSAMQLHIDAVEPCVTALARALAGFYKEWQPPQEEAA
jgi:hypothetical protein